MACDVLVLNAELRQGLVSVRSLGHRGRGLRVAAAAHDRHAPVFASRWCAEGFFSPHEEDAAAYGAWLEQCLETTGARTLIPSHDGTIALLRQHRAQLEDRTCLALSSEPALAVAVNKERTSRVARQLGIQVPHEVVLRDVADAGTAVNEIGLPAVVKPGESWVSNGGGTARVSPALVVSRDEACRATEAITRLGGFVLLQQFLTGRREAVSFLYAGGEMYARFAQWAKRTYPPLGGTSVLRQSIRIPPDIGPQAETLIREINLEGYSEVEFRRDAAGIPYLMEINPRLSASVEIAVRAGVDFPYLLYQWASSGRVAKGNGYRVGTWMRHLGGDIESTIEALQQPGRPGVPPRARTLVDFAVSFLKPMGYDYFDWKDPLPAVRATTGFVRAALRRVRSRVRKLIL